MSEFRKIFLRKFLEFVGHSYTYTYMEESLSELMEGFLWDFLENVCEDI